MMTNLECSQAESNGTMTVEDQARSVDKCTRRYIIGYEKIAAALAALKWGSKDTDEFIIITKKNTEQIETEQRTLKLYGILMATSISGNDEEATTTAIITGLVNMHASLVGINALIEKRTPMMQKNCMK